MNCDAVRELLGAYLEKETTVEETVKIEEHLKECAECREELKFQQEMLEMLKGLPDAELPEGYHAELMQKLQAEAAPNVVPFPVKKKKQPVYKQWGMIAAAVLVVVAAGGMNGMLEMRESQNAVVQQMQATDTSGSAETAEVDVVSAEETVAYSGKTMQIPAAAEEKMEVTAAYDTASVSAEEEPMTYSMTRTVEVTAENKAVLKTADTALAMAELQKAVAEAGGFEENAEEGSVFAVIPVENYDNFVNTVAELGTLEWTQQKDAEIGAAYRTIEIQLN